MIRADLFYDGAILAGRSRRGGDLIHCVRLNVGTALPGTYSYGARCGVGNGGLVMLGHWNDAEPTWRRCAKCIRRQDELFLLAVEYGGEIPHTPIRIKSKWLGDD